MTAACRVGSKTAYWRRPWRLGGVHRDVGVAEQVVDALRGTGAHDDADADADHRFLAAHREARAEDLHQSAGDRQCALESRLVVDQDRELVAAQPGSHVSLAEAATDAIADHDQQLVAGGVAEGVVDRLEVVEVEEEDHRPDAVRPRHADPRDAVSANETRFGSPVSGSW